MVIDFEKLLIKEKNNVSILKLRKNIINLIKYLKSIQNYFDGNTLKMKKYVFDELDEQLEEYLKILSTDLIQREVSALDTLNNNPHLLKKYYEKLKDIDLEDFDLNKDKDELRGNEKDCQIFEVKVLLQSIRREKDTIDPIMMKFAKNIYECKDPKEKENYKKELEKDLELKQMYEYVEIFLQESEEEMLKKYNGYRLKNAKTMLKDNEKRRLKTAGEFFKKYDLLEKMRNRINADYEEIGLGEMCYPERTENLQEDIGVENIFEDEYIDKLDDEQLAVLNAYWQNRYTKEAENIKNALFSIENLQLWEHILDDNILDNVTDDELWNSLQKIRICNNVFKKIKDKAVITEEVAPNITCNLLDLDQIDKKFKTQYKNYFDKAFPQNQNDFNQDFYIGQSTRNIIDAIYNIKSINIKQLLLNIERSSKITNWGYIEEKKQGVNSIKREMDNILIGIDYPGFNIPIGLHTNREQLLEYFRQTKENTIIPIYEGEKDGEYRGKLRARSLLMPLTEKRESFIIKMNKQAKTIDKNYILIRHLGNLVTKKAKGIEKIYPKKYVNLENGDIGYKVKGEFVVENTDIGKENEKI